MNTHEPKLEPIIRESGYHDFGQSSEDGSVASMDSSATGDSDYAFSSPALLHLGRPVEDNAASSEWQDQEYACIAARASGHSRPIL